MKQASAHTKIWLIFIAIAFFALLVQAGTTQIHYAGFESGAQGWNDPGSDSRRLSEGGGNNPPPSKCNDSENCNNAGSKIWHLQDDSSTSYTEQEFDFSSYDTVNLTFWSREWSWETNEYVRVLCDNTEIWRQTDGEFSQGQWLHKSIQVHSANCTFDSAVTIRFDAAPGLSNNGDEWYLDGINLTGITASAGDVIWWLLLVLALLAVLMAYLTSKRLFKKSKPFNFKVRREESSTITRTLKQFFRKRRQNIHKRTKHTKTQHLNSRTPPKKIMAGEPDKLTKLEGLISDEFIQKIRGKEEKADKKITPQQYKTHFPETMKELIKKGIHSKQLQETHERPRTEKVVKNIQERKKSTTYPELQKLFPETLGKIKAKDATKSILLEPKPTQKKQEGITEDSFKKSYTFKEEEPKIEEQKKRLEANRKINKKTNKQDMLDNLDEVYDI